MWDWILHHWYLSVTVPYFALNGWIVYVFQRDEGFFDWHEKRDIGFALVMFGIGAPLAVFFILQELPVRLRSIIMDMYAAHGHRISSRLVSRWIAVVLGTAGFWLVLLIVHLLFVAYFGWRPGFFTRLGAPWALGLISFFTMKKVFKP